MGGRWDRNGHRLRVCAVDGTDAAQRRLDAIWAPGYTGQRRGEVVRTRTIVLPMHTHQWRGPFGGQGHGDSRGELAAVRQAVEASLAAWGLPCAEGVVRVDGPDGDPAVMAQIVNSGLQVVVRGRGYPLLEQPQGHANVTPTSVPVSITRPASQTTDEVFDIPHLRLGADQLCCWVILTRHGWTGAPATVGKRVGTGVYALCVLTTLPAGGFLATAVLDRYHGRGAGEGALADAPRRQQRAGKRSRPPRVAVRTAARGPAACGAPAAPAGRPTRRGARRAGAPSRPAGPCGRPPAPASTHRPPSPAAS
jgi:hypothetical protein